MDRITLQPVFNDLQRLLENESLSKEECRYISDSLIHFRNNLCISEEFANEVSGESIVTAVSNIIVRPNSFVGNFTYHRSDIGSHLPKNCILWNLFTLGIDRLLINLLAHAEKAKWITTIAELIALFYKERNDQNGVLNFLGIGVTASGDSDRPILSRSLENSANAHLKPTNRRRMSDDVTEFFQPEPTEKEMSKLLTQFTLNFLLRGYNILVSQLHEQLLLQKENNVNQNDKSDFVWFISYFLPFVSQLKMNLNLFKDIFTIDILCYLTWESVRQTEEFEMNSLRLPPPVDLKSNQRRLHRSVKAILEYLRILEEHTRPSNNFEKHGLRRELQERVCKQLCSYLPAARDIRQLFLLQLLQFNPDIQSRRYLCDVVTANHLLLLILERVPHEEPGGANFNLHQHLNQFCTKTIMARYGTALECFRTNGPFVNDCIFTMLHHVGCDLREIALVCQPNIMRHFASIWQEAFQIADDWHDLISYAVHIFNLSRGKIGNISPDRETSEFLNPDDWRSMEFESLTSQTFNNDDDELENLRTDFESLLILLKGDGFQKQLDWIQSSLLTACAARLGIYSDHEFRHPITCLSLKLNTPCPIVPWTEAEASALSSKPFRFFLRQLGLFPSLPHAGTYPRIPLEWSPDTLYNVALSLGSVVHQQVDFDLSCVGKL